MTERPDTAWHIRWCNEPALAGTVADFFVRFAPPAYISHSELQFGRAEEPDRWAGHLPAIIKAEAERAIAKAPEDAGQYLALAFADEVLVGLAFVSFAPDAATPFAVLDDLLVDPATRGLGLGRTFLDWISDQCRARGMRRMFLESGRDNHRAHHFFEHHGFWQTSIVMMRDL